MIYEAGQCLVLKQLKAQGITLARFVGSISIYYVASPIAAKTKYVEIVFSTFPTHRNASKKNK